MTYVIPLVGLSVTYTHLGMVLWKNNRAPHQTLSSSRKVRDKRKVGGALQFFIFTTMIIQIAKMFIVILIVFGGCWLPYHTYFIYTYYHTVGKIVT